MTALGKYLSEDDGAFKWDLVRTTEVDGVKVYDIRLTSQTWRVAGEVDHPVWTHWLTIGVPAKVESATPIMVVGGGRRRDEPREKPSNELMMFLRGSGAIVCVIDNVPNQPVRFAGDDHDRTEDDLLAHTWNLAMEKDDARWIGRFPMVKSVKRAMDAAEQFLGKQDLSFAALNGTPIAPGFRPDGFFVTGASKRGWTTWLIGAVDPRVKAICPIVIDVLNLKAQTAHHWASYGFWAPALKDYVNNHIAEKFGSPELAKVMVHEDPLAYMKFLGRIPKLIVTASGDEFFPADSFQHYEKLIAGEWRLRTVPNAGHNLAGSAAPLEVLAFYKAVAAGDPRPTLTWELTKGESGPVLTATAGSKPERVVVWVCEGRKTRDFRFAETGKSWTSTEVTPADGTGLTYRWIKKTPEEGYTAFFMEFTFPPAKAFGPSMVFTTRAFVTPDVLPFEGKQP
jgi:PhoPQ-activated pathogenicity-related protein